MNIKMQDAIGTVFYTYITVCCDGDDIYSAIIWDFRSEESLHEHFWIIVHVVYSKIEHNTKFICEKF